MHRFSRLSESALGRARATSAGKSDGGGREGATGAGNSAWRTASTIDSTGLEARCTRRFDDSRRHAQQVRRTGVCHNTQSAASTSASVAAAYGAAAVAYGAAAGCSWLLLPQPQLLALVLPPALYRLLPQPQLLALVLPL